MKMENLIWIQTVLLFIYKHVYKEITEDVEKRFATSNFEIDHYL